MTNVTRGEKKEQEVTTAAITAAENPPHRSSKGHSEKEGDVGGENPEEGILHSLRRRLALNNREITKLG